MNTPHSLTEENLVYWLAWSMLVQGRQLKRLMDLFNSGEAAWHAPVTELRPLGWAPETLEKITTLRLTLDPQELMQKIIDNNIKFIAPQDQCYPNLLGQIHDAPAILFYRGRLPAPEELLLAVVGTRMASRYGQAVTTALVRELSANGLVIVSGLARGIDALAHEAALVAGGCTIGVLGTGLLDADIYPHEHIRLAQRIIERGGAIISEYPPGVGPERHHFPERNRIIAGLTLGTLVIEAPETSGALITAKLALEYDREVLAVPGNIFEKNSAGVNDLLKLGARVVTSTADVQNALQLQGAAGAKIERHPEVSDEEMAVFQVLSKNPIHIDIVRHTVGLDSGTLGSILTTLELKGVVKDIGGKHYIKL